MTFELVIQVSQKPLWGNIFLAVIQFMADGLRKKTFIEADGKYEEKKISVQEKIF